MNERVIGNNEFIRVLEEMKAAVKPIEVVDGDEYHYHEPHVIPDIKIKEWVCRLERAYFDDYEKMLDEVRECSRKVDMMLKDREGLKAAIGLLKGPEGMARGSHDVAISAESLMSLPQVVVVLHCTHRCDEFGMARYRCDAYVSGGTYDHATLRLARETIDETAAYAMLKMVKGDAK